MENGIDRIMVMIAGSILLLSIFPFVSANPVPYLNWWDAQAGGSPEPKPRNTNVTFFKEFVKADIDEKAVHLYADYWFRNEGEKNDTIKLLLPLSLNPREIDLWVDDSIWDWDESHYYGYEAITFDLLIPQFKEVRVTLEFWEDLSIYNHSGVYHYCYSYLVGSARAWNRNLESASFEFRIPVSMYDRGEYDGWNRERDGSDYVFTKEYSDWLPFDEDYEYLEWEKDRKDRSILSKPIMGDSKVTIGTILMFIGIFAVIIVILVTALIIYRSRKKRRKE